MITDHPSAMSFSLKKMHKAIAKWRGTLENCFEDRESK